jgi:glycine dehydrogenase subunit 2
MIEPTETESKESMDEAAATYLKLYDLAKSDPEALHAAPMKANCRRLDEVGAARNPIVRYTF